MYGCINLVDEQSGWILFFHVVHVNEFEEGAMDGENIDIRSHVIIQENAW